MRWSFGQGFEIAVALYAMLQTAVKGSHTYLKAQNNEPLRSEGAYICNDTGEISLAKARAALHGTNCEVRFTITPHQHRLQCGSVEKSRGHNPTCRRLFSSQLTHCALAWAHALQVHLSVSLVRRGCCCCQITFWLASVEGYSSAYYCTSRSVISNSVCRPLSTQNSTHYSRSAGTWL